MFEPATTSDITEECNGSGDNHFHGSSPDEHSGQGSAGADEGQIPTQGNKHTTTLRSGVPAGDSANLCSSVEQRHWVSERRKVKSRKVTMEKHSFYSQLDSNTLTQHPEKDHTVLDTCHFPTHVDEQAIERSTTKLMSGVPGSDSMSLCSSVERRKRISKRKKGESTKIREEEEPLDVFSSQPTNIPRSGNSYCSGAINATPGRDDGLGVTPECLSSYHQSYTRQTDMAISLEDEEDGAMPVPPTTPLLEVRGSCGSSFSGTSSEFLASSSAGSAQPRDYFDSHVQIRGKRSDKKKGKKKKKKLKTSLRKLVTSNKKSKVRPDHSAQIEELQKQVEEVKEEMRQNLEKLNERHGKVEDMVERSEKLEQSAKEFFVTVQQLPTGCWDAFKRCIRCCFCCCCV